MKIAICFNKDGRGNKMNGFLIVYWACCGVVTLLNVYFIIGNTIEIRRLHKENELLKKMLQG